MSTKSITLCALGVIGLVLGSVIGWAQTKRADKILLEQELAVLSCPLEAKSLEERLELRLTILDQSTQDGWMITRNYDALYNLYPGLEPCFQEEYLRRVKNVYQTGLELSDNCQSKNRKSFALNYVGYIYNRLGSRPICKDFREGQKISSRPSATSVVSTPAGQPLI